MSTTALTTPFLTLPPPPSRSSSGNVARRRLAAWKPRGKGVCALHRDAFDHGYDGKLVDQDMIVLRKRIHEVRAAEGLDDDGGGDVVSSDWMEWEKEYYVKDYGADVCEALGMLQYQLMNTRPSFSLLMLVVVLLSLPFSTGVVLLRLMDVAKDVFLGHS